MLHFRKARLALPLPTKSATIALFAGFSLIAACGAKKDSPAGKPAPKPEAGDATKQGTNPNAEAASPAGAFLKWSDFEAYALPQDTKTDANSVLHTLTWESLLYANFPEDNTDPASDSSLTPQERAEAQAEQKCRDESDAKGMQIGIENDLIKINFKKKDTCSKEGWYSIETTLSMQCVGIDLSSLKGKSFKELEPILKIAQQPNGVCGKANEFRIFRNQKFESEYTYDIPAYTSEEANWQYGTTEPTANSSLQPYPSPSPYITTKAVSRSTGISAQMQPNGTPCVQKRKENTLVLEGECWAQDASRRAEEYSPQSGRKSTTSVDRYIYKIKGAIEPVGTKDAWLTGGTFEVTINEWKGTVTFSPKGAPRAVLTSPSGAKIDQLVPFAQYDAPNSEVKQSASEANVSSSSGQSDSKRN